MDKKRDNKRFEIKLKVGEDEFGKAIRRSFYSTKSKKDAKEKGLRYIEETAVQNAIGPTAPKRNMKFKTLVVEYLEVYKKGHVKANTFFGTYSIPVKKYLIPEFGDRNIDTIRNTEIQKYINELAKRLSEETIRKILNCLRAIFFIAYNDCLISRNPMNWRFDIPKTKPGIVKHVYTQEQYDRVLRFAKKHPKGLAVEVLLQTGITRSELLGLKPKNLLASKQIAIVQGTTESWDPDTKKMLLSSEGLKTKYRRRTIPISTDLYNALKARCSHPISVKKGKTIKQVIPEFIFYSPEGKEFRPNNWYSREYLPFMKAMHRENPDIPMLNPHEIRHTLATLLNNRGINPVILNHLFGWRGNGMLETRYAHYDPESARKSLNLK